MDETTLFLGPDPEIMRDHSISARLSARRAHRRGRRPVQVERIRKRVAGTLDEGYEMCEAWGPHRERSGVIWCRESTPHRAIWP